MGTFIIFLLCSLAVVIAHENVTLEADVPFLDVQHKGTAILKCCYTSKSETENFKWIRRVQIGNTTERPDPVNRTDMKVDKTEAKPCCGVLTLFSVQVNDTGFYQCLLVDSNILTHGTFLRVYVTLEKTINLSESTKNKILTAEGVLLFLCVILPSAALLCKSRRLNELEKKKVKKEEENIYQGLNLDDCCSAYDQIERSTANCQYEDVCNIMEEEEEIQLEKP